MLQLVSMCRNVENYPNKNNIISTMIDFWSTFRTIVKYKIIALNAWRST